jgi:hypothetical protein
VTPLGIFDDVQDAVHQLPGTTPEQMAQGLRLLIDKLALADEDISGKAQAASRWCMAHRHSSLAQRMTNMLTGLHGQYRVRG